VTTKFDLKILAQLGVVFAVMLTVKWFADQQGVIGAGGIAMWCAIITATVLMKRDGIKWADFGLSLPRGRGEWLRTVGVALLAVVAVILFMALVLSPVVEALGLEMSEDATDRFAFFLGKPLVFAAYLVVVVWFGAAMGEELLMRGFVLNRLGDFFGRGVVGWAIAVMIHSVIFGSLHAYQGPAGILATGMVAMIFGTVYLLFKRRLVPLILAHGLINTISLTGYYLTDGAMT